MLSIWDCYIKIYYGSIKNFLLLFSGLSVVVKQQGSLRKWYNRSKSYPTSNRQGVKAILSNKLVKALYIVACPQ